MLEYRVGTVPDLLTQASAVSNVLGVSNVLAAYSCGCGCARQPGLPSLACLAWLAQVLGSKRLYGSSTIPLSRLPDPNTQCGINS